jgi:uncharacterized membrane protein
MNTKQIAYNALIISLIAVMAFVPWLGIITYGPLSATTLHIIVIIAALLLGGKSAIIASLAFGVSTMLVAISRGLATDLLFMNPLVSVLPRLMFGFVLAGLVKVFNKPQSDNTFTDITIAVVGTIAHTFLVLGALFFVLELPGNFLEQLTTWWAAVVGILLVNTLPEIVAAVLIAVPVVKVLRRTLR